MKAMSFLGGVLLVSSSFSAKQAAAYDEWAPVYMNHACKTCNPHDLNDPEVSAILSRYAQEDPGSKIQIVNENNEQELWEKTPAQGWRATDGFLPLVPYELHLQRNDGYVPGWGSTEITEAPPAGGVGTGGWQPIYVAATVCSGNYCTTEWIIVGYGRV